ncbi:response regulator [Algoriphagus sanaruensis]|uniref:Response regulatory domain-containing protein n=1 Tax=Algoriphagus sanaruensis TaxID=1727163 RepID=A0A142EMY6_9BACT|nr:response regulator [Algoriphagus sanaruensis]AMQ56491.1 hypothetical protein AO498_08685 [Algoriphagus sanaruensis]
MNFKLIIVDDDTDYQFFHKLLAMKAEFHHDPICLSSGREAIEYLEKEKDSKDNILIFLDLYMVDMDGWQVLDYIESLDQPHRIKVIVITSSVNMADKKKAIRYSCIIEYIEKPLMKNYLIALKQSQLFLN